MRYSVLELSLGFLLLLAALAPATAQEISEFMASNNETLVDGNGNASDWIEVYNPTGAAIGLAGWTLTDDQDNLEKWSFPPGVILGPGDYRIVFASSQDQDDVVDPGGFLHTNFALSRGGEYLALVMPDGTTVVSEYSPQYPPQSPDISYGLFDGKAQFFTTPTPGAPNQANPVPTPQFSRLGGLITEPFNLVLSLDRAGADIRFTLDGSVPNEESDLYTSPLVIDTTTHVRARAFTNGADPGPVVSHSYLLLGEDVQQFSSNLPLVVIDSLGVNINADAGTESDRSNAPRRPAYSVFLDTGEDGRTRLTDVADFAGRAGMKIRGYSSQAAPKKQYSLETWDEEDDDKNVSILDLPAESDWVFHAPYGDKTLMRNYLAYKWWGELGRYSVRTRFCELFYNFNDGVVSMDDYAGVYVFMEKIKRDDDRVNVTKLTPDDVSEPEITGGYIVKVDVPDAGETHFRTGKNAPPFWPWNGFIITEPKPEDITPAQEAWIKNTINDFEVALFGADFTDPDLGYASTIDVESFIDYFLYTEALKNGDGFYLSIFYHKERGEKLTMGPIWDFNVCLGNDADWNAWDPEGWLSEASGSFWYRRLFQDPAAVEQRRERWREWRREFFATDRLLGDIDETARLLDEAQKRNFERWDILGRFVQPEQVNPRGYRERDTYEKEVAWMREWLIDRLAWLDGQFLEPPSFSVAGGRVSPATELALLNPNEEGEIIYTLNGPDPRRAGGEIAPEGRVFQDPIVVTDNVVVRARVRIGDTIWSSLAEAKYIVNAPSLTLTEIMYNPTDGNDFEFIELFNFGDSPVDLRSVSLTQGALFDFADSLVQSLEPGEYAVVVRNLVAFTSLYGIQGIKIAGEYTGSLSNRRETITVEMAIGGPSGDRVPILSIEYDDDWYPETDGEGPSLVRIDPHSPPETWGDPQSWRPSSVAGGSPGRGDTATGGGQVPGDGNQDGKFNLVDTIFLLRYLFQGAVDRLPCGDGSSGSEANRALLDTNGDSELNSADAIFNLAYLFLDGPPPVQGRACVEMLDCPNVCLP